MKELIKKDNIYFWGATYWALGVSINEFSNTINRKEDFKTDDHDEVPALQSQIFLL